MNHQALGVADVGQVREHLQRFDEAAAGLEPALNAERQNAARAARQVALGQRVIGARRAGRDS